MRYMRIYEGKLQHLIKHIHALKYTKTLEEEEQHLNDFAGMKEDIINYGTSKLNKSKTEVIDELRKCHLQATKEDRLHNTTTPYSHRS
jgi:hypothetical protein